MITDNAEAVIYAWTTASGGEKQIAIYFVQDHGTGQEKYYLENGAECTNLLFYQDGELWYEGGGLLERLLGKSFKGTSEDFNKLQKYIIIGALVIALLALTIPMITAKIKTLKIKK